MKKFLTIIFLELVNIFFFSSLFAEELTLNQALSLAYKNNPQIQAERAALRVVDENHFQAFSGFLPQASLEASRGEESLKRKGSEEQKGDVENKTARITQPIFQGGKTLASMSQADANISSARAKLSAVEQQILLDTVKAYMDVIYAKKVLDLSENNEEVLQKHLNVAKEKFELGEVTKTDVSQAEARLARAVSDRITNQGSLDSTRATLEKMVGIDADILSSPEDFPEIPSLKEDELLEIAFKSNPDLKASEANIDVAKYATRSAKADILPRVSLEASKTRDESRSAFLSGKQTIDTSAVQLNLTIPIFQAGVEYSRVRQELERSSQAKEEYMSSKRLVAENTVKSLRELNAVRSSIESHEANVKAAEIAMEGVAREEEVGARTTLDLLDSEQELLDARVKLEDAKRQEVIGIYNLLAQIGYLSAQNLKITNEIYDPKINQEKVRYKMIGF